MKGRKAFSLVELLVVIAILGLLIGILLPALGRAKELSYRSVCTNHLKELTKACGAYAIDTREQGDVARCLPVVSPVPTAANWFTGDVGNRAGLWLLVSGSYVSTDIFVCPAATTYKPAAKDSPTKLAWNNCSYSYVSMVGLVNPEGNNRPSISMASPNFLGNLVVAADLNPRFKPDDKAFADSNNGWGAGNPSKNSLIHGKGEGQNLARIDTSVIWSATSTISTGNATTGVNANDCVYESSTPASDADGSARALNDVFLLP